MCGTGSDPGVPHTRLTSITHWACSLECRLPSKEKQSFQEAWAEQCQAGAGAKPPLPTAGWRKTAVLAGARLPEHLPHPGTLPGAPALMVSPTPALASHASSACRGALASSPCPSACLSRA